MNKHISTFLILLGIWTFPAASRLFATDAWFIDTRSATLKSKGERIEDLTVNRLSEHNPKKMSWESATLDLFLQTHQPEKPLMIIIHGNWMTFPEAKQHGIMFHRLSRNEPDHRLLVWSWPSDKVYCNPRKDALLKAQRADVQAKFLAAFLRKLPAQSKVSLVGFSFGSKLSCQTLELLVSTTSSSYQNQAVGHDLRIRTVLLAAAMDRQSLAPGHRYGQALLATEKMLVYVNRHDEVLRYYPLLVGIGGPKAVGKEGIVGLPASFWNKVRQVNIDLDEHLFMNSLRGFLYDKHRFREYALFLNE